MSEFEGQPLSVVAKRTEKADRDFADWRVSKSEQDRIARYLKDVPYSEDDDVIIGDVRLRPVGEGFEVAFMLLAHEDKFTVLVIGYDRAGVIETQLEHLWRSSKDILNPGVKSLIEGRKRKSDV